MTRHHITMQWCGHDAGWFQSSWAGYVPIVQVVTSTFIYISFVYNSYYSSSDVLHFLCPDFMWPWLCWLAASLSLGVFMLRAASNSVGYSVWTCQLGALSSCQTWETSSSHTELHCNHLSRKEFTCRPVPEGPLYSWPQIFKSVVFSRTAALIY